MIERLQLYARRLYRIRALIYVLAGGWFAVFLYALGYLSGPEQDQWMIPSVLGGVWSLLLVSMLSIFPNVPTKLSRDMGLFRRIKNRVSRFGFYLVGILFIGVSCALVIFTYRMVSVWLIQE